MVHIEGRVEMILAVETSTEVCSVALALPGVEIREKREIGRGIHSEKLFRFLHDFLESGGWRVSDLEHVLVSRGPGHYTGLRIGAAGIKGLLFGSTVPLSTIGTLTAFSAGPICSRGVSGTIHCVLDARREHLYHQVISADSRNLRAGEARIRRLDDIGRDLRAGDHLIGTGIERLSGSAVTGISVHNYDAISAKNLILAYRDSRYAGFFERVDPERFDPDYLGGEKINNTNV